MSIENIGGHSFFKKPSFLVAQKAQDMLDWIIAERKRLAEEYIKLNRGYMMNKWWHKFRNKPVPTDDEVKTYIVKDNIWNNELTYIAMYFGNTEQLCIMLLNAAKTLDKAEDINMYLSIHDWSKINQ